MMDEKFSIEKNSSLANTNPEQYYFMQDQVMSIKAARKTTQEKVGIYDYSAYGEKVISVNNPVTNNIPVAGGVLTSLLGTILPPATIPQTLQSNPAEDFGYTGREDNNGVDGLMYYRNRYFSTKFKSFISEDPIGLAGGMNQYAYVEGNPISYSDPMGLEIYTIEVWDALSRFETPFGAEAGIGHVKITDKHGNTVLDQWPFDKPNEWGTKKPYNKILGFNGIPPNEHSNNSEYGHRKRTFWIDVPNDKEFNNTARKERSKPLWSVVPSLDSANSTNCVYAANQALNAGGVNVGNPLFPSDLGNILEGIDGVMHQ